MKTATTDILIIGAGLSGLSTAHFLKKQNPQLDIQLLERSSRAGGAIQSLNKEGFLAEWGPHGFLDNVAESRELLDDLQIVEETQLAPLKQFLRYVCHKGKLVQIPQTPPKILRSNLLSLPSKIRVLGDLVRKPMEGEPTIADWTAHRFGKAMVPFADIVVTGTFAGDIERLSIDAAYPGIRRLEKEYGSVFKGAILSRKNAEKRGMPSMVSFKKGMEQMIHTLSADKTISLNTSVTSIAKEEKGWVVTTDKGLFKCQKLILATQINQGIEILKDLQQPPKPSVNEAIINNVVLGFKEEAEIPFGFGYLAPKGENRFALGTLFSIHMFPGRAPKGYKLIEILVGGTRNPEFLNLDDTELVDKALADVTSLLHLPTPPVFTNVIRPKAAIPQLELGHLEFQSYRDQLEMQHEGLFICGFGWEGIGMNDVIKHAKQTAEKLLKGDRFSKAPAQAKGIYV